MTGAELLRSLHDGGATLTVDGPALVYDGPHELRARLAPDLALWRDVLWTLHHPGVRAELARWPSWARGELLVVRGALEARGTPRGLASPLALLQVGTAYVEADDGQWSVAGGVEAPAASRVG